MQGAPTLQGGKLQPPPAPGACVCRVNLEPYPKSAHSKAAGEHPGLLIPLPRNPWYLDPLPGLHPTTAPREQGRDPEVSLPATDTEPASAFNVGAAAPALAACRIPALGVPEPPARAQRSGSHLTRVLASATGHSTAPPRPHLPGRSAWAAWGCSPTASVQPLASHGHLSPVTAAATGRSGWSWPEPRPR